MKYLPESYSLNLNKNLNNSSRAQFFMVFQIKLYNQCEILDGVIKFEFLLSLF